MEQVYQHDFAFPGAYRKVTVELKVLNIVNQLFPEFI